MERISSEFNFSRKQTNHSHSSPTQQYHKQLLHQSYITVNNNYNYYYLFITVIIIEFLMRHFIDKWANSVFSGSLRLESASKVTVILPLIPHIPNPKLFVICEDHMLHPLTVDGVCLSLFFKATTTITKDY